MNSKDRFYSAMNYDGFDRVPTTACRWLVRTMA